MKKFIQHFSRSFVALTFIFSGFVKAIDPFGSAVKFEDYFIAFGFEWLTPIALTLSFALILFEFLIGFYLVFGIYIKQTSLVAFATISFFTILTLILAIFNPVTDCGCFGDAIKLTNWQTFWKNIVIIIPTFYVFKNRNEFNFEYNILAKAIIVVVPAIYIFSFSLYNHRHLPILDFRPYKIGVNLTDGMSIPADAPQPVYETIFTLSKDGVEKTFSLEEYPYEDTTWEFVSSETKIISEGYVPPLSDFSVLNKYQDDLTQDITNHKGGQLLLVSPNVNKINKKTISKIRELSQASISQDTPFYLLTSSSYEDSEEFENSNDIYFSNLLFADEVTLKTIIRSNPGLVAVYDGTIIGKYHYNDLPNTKFLNNPLAYSIEKQQKKSNTNKIWMHIFGLLFISTIIINILKTIKTTK